jgi:cation transport ATPase
MIHTYSIAGMTCTGCSAKVQYLLSKVPKVTSVNVNLEKGQAEIDMKEHLSMNDFKKALDGTKYTITEQPHQMSNLVQTFAQDQPVTIKTYLPIFLIFGYITAVTLFIQFTRQTFDIKEWMAHFMAGFFLVFSFFKLLDVPAFAMSYSSYDIVAKRWLGYGYIYPFVELFLGISFLIPSFYWWSNVFTLIVMSVSIVGVLQSVLKKQKIKCACLGAVFNLPMSTVTIIEDALMILMSGISLILV